MVNNIVTVAVDAMGGDFAPEQNVKGAILAAAQNGLRIILVGDLEAIKPHLHSQPDNLLIRHAPDVIEMHEAPAWAVRKKPQSSLVVAANLVKNGEADVLVSAGNTGACAAAGLLILGRLKNIGRPAIATIFPTLKGSSLLIDVGANADCKPEHLVEFAQMGSVYANQMLGISEPTVGLLNIGEESSKGNFLALRAYKLLQNSNLNFVGNVEGRDLPEGTVDVFVCDGFTGNVTLKLMEGLAGALFSEMRQILTKSLKGKIGGLLLASGLKAFHQKINPENYGGSPMLGLKEIIMIAHGRSSPLAIANAIKAAAKAVEQQVVARIEQNIITGE